MDRRCEFSGTTYLSGDAGRWSVVWVTQHSLDLQTWDRCINGALHPSGKQRIGLVTRMIFAPNLSQALHIGSLGRACKHDLSVPTY
jgi:hypothetical protein